MNPPDVTDENDISWLNNIDIDNAEANLDFGPLSLIAIIENDCPYTVGSPEVDPLFCQPPPPMRITPLSDADPWRCPKCVMNFSGKKELYYHNKEHHPHFICSECNAHFLKWPPYKLHLAIHEGKKQYNCEICGKCYTRATSLINHRKTHFSAKSFICQICGKAFYQKSNLVSHINTHTNSRPYKCSTCGFGFNQKSNLNAHVKKYHRFPTMNTLAAVNQHVQRGASFAIPLFGLSNFRC